MNKYKKVMAVFGETIKKLMPDILAVGGTVCIAYGAYLFLKPIGFIVLGILLIGGAYIWSKSD